MTRPPRTRTPSSTHSQIRPVPEPPPDTPAVGAGLLPPAAEGAVAATVVTALEGAAAGVDGAAAGVEGAVVAPEVAVLLVTLPTALLTALPHPATRHPAARIATRTRKPLLMHRMVVLPRGPRPAAPSMIGLTRPRRPHPPGTTFSQAPPPLGEAGRRPRSGSCEYAFHPPPGGLSPGGPSLGDSSLGGSRSPGDGRDRTLAALRPAGARSSARGHDRRAPGRDRQRARRHGGRRPGRGEPGAGSLRELRRARRRRPQLQHPDDGDHHDLRGRPGRGLGPAGHPG